MFYISIIWRKSQYFNFGWQLDKRQKKYYNFRYDLI